MDTSRSGASDGLSGNASTRESRTSIESSTSNNSTENDDSLYSLRGLPRGAAVSAASGEFRAEQYDRSDFDTHRNEHASTYNPIYQRSVHRHPDRHRHHHHHHHSDSSSDVINPSSTIPIISSERDLDDLVTSETPLLSATEPVLITPAAAAANSPEEQQLVRLDNVAISGVLSPIKGKSLLKKKKPPKLDLDIAGPVRDFYQSTGDADQPVPSRPTHVTPQECTPKVGFIIGSDVPSSADADQTLSPRILERHHTNRRAPYQRRLSQDHHQATPPGSTNVSVTITEQEEADLLANADLDDLASHRFDDPRGIRRHRIQQRGSVVTQYRVTEATSIADKPLAQQVPPECDRTPHDGFVELNELVNNHWRETARWIKYEEDVEQGVERWGAPHVASLSFHDLVTLKKYLGNSVVMPDVTFRDFSDLCNRIVETMSEAGQIESGEGSVVLKTLLALPQTHHHYQENQGGPLRFLRRNSSFGRQLSTSSSLCNTTQDVAENPVRNHSVPLLTSDIKITLERIVNGGNTAVDQHHRRLSDSHGGSVQDLCPKSDILHRIPDKSEATCVLVGGLQSLRKPAVAFVRLSKGEFIPNVIEVPLPIRFFFICLGPLEFDLDYHELGRCFSTLMSYRTFHDAAYDIVSQQDLVRALNNFLSDTIVLPPGDYENKALLPVEDLRKKSENIRNRRKIKSMMRKVQKLRDQHLPEKKAPVSVEHDALRRQGKLFGGLRTEIKKRYPKYLDDIRDGFNGQCFASIVFIYFASLSGAITFGGLLSDETHNLIGVAETLLISCVTGMVFALLSGQPLIIVGVTGPVLLFDQLLYKIFVAHPLLTLPGYMMANNVLNSTNPMPLANLTTQALSNDAKNQPNTALMSLLLMLSTFVIGDSLRRLKGSKFLGRTSRRIVGDFAMPITLVIVVSIDYVMTDVFSQKLQVPDGLATTTPRPWVVNPITERAPFIWWHVFAVAPIAALLVFILLFLEIEICELIMNKKERMCVRGTGFHLDLLLICSMQLGSAMVGGPWICAATVRSVSHQAALTVMSRNHAPGDTPRVVAVHEQRVTGFVVSLLIGVSVLMSSVLRQVPVAVLFGVFLYMGFTSMLGIEFFERIVLLFRPTKYFPPGGYAQKVRASRMHAYTLIQICCLVLLWVVKSSSLALAFPFVLVLMIPLRSQLRCCFAKEELDVLDGDRSQMIVVDTNDEIRA